ncbi:hypothetical protein R69927_06032 [Paraburkholderia domus]|uniref:Uncharacterized protein n=1 Tax=Paraburkholderia domus TaxID=2793075 RepID=A0A9N8N509_9BURK|nr:hypothetical protein R70006_05630 [Paraburkholderia domus]CAE6911644.1 hypothetical protein R69927_06032 [Paraburkholderia domus]CAE6939051.1 hypothetical protein R75471_05231 [Paraburkholderia domus]CAE6954993.1 hypothetical protein R70211_06504 [Paraburkholderia domus]
MLAENLHRDGALAGDHVRIVERVNKRQAAFFLQLHRVPVCIAIRLAELHHLDRCSAMRAHRIDLHLRRRHRHDDDRLHTHPGRRQRHALRMIARRRGNHPAFQRLRRNVRHLVVRAAHLEREHRLVVLALQINRIGKACRQIRRAFEFGLAGHVVDARGQGFLQVVVAQRHAVSGFGHLFEFV